MERHITVELTSRSSAHRARVTIRDNADNVINDRGNGYGPEFASNDNAWTYVEQFTVNAHNVNYSLTVIG